MCALGCGAQAPSPAPAEPVRLTPEQLLAAIQQPRDPSADGDAGLGLDELLEAHATPGLSIAVWHDGVVTWTHGVGTADRATGAPVTSETLFQAASISKPASAIAAVRLTSTGQLGLDRPIGELLVRVELENPWAATSPVTPRRLMSHTAGTTVHGFPGYPAGSELPSAIDVVLGTELTNTDPVVVATEPGTEELYSGGGSTLLQIAMEDVTDRPFTELVRDLVLEPLGMTSSTVEQPPPREIEARTARGHISGEVGAVRYHVYPEQFAAGLWTTPGDLARMAIAVQQALLGTRDGPITPEQAELLTTPVGVGSYAVGFNTQERGVGAEEVWYFSHSGGNWGFTCNLVARTGGRYGSVVMSNGSGGIWPVLEVQRRIARAAGWEGDLAQWPRNWPPQDEE